MDQHGKEEDTMIKDNAITVENMVTSLGIAHFKAKGSMR